MYRKIDDFLDGWAYEIEATLKVYRQLTDESLEQRVTAEGRTLGRVAWHIVQTLPEMGGRTGLEITGPGETDPVPDSAAEITERFEEAANSLSDEVRSTWTDEDLDVEDEMYGEMWTRRASLSAILHHQTHHRGQMTVLMRQAGLKVPGVYGPAKEEWEAYGMPPQD